MESSLSWSTVSNAVDKFRRTKHDQLPLPTVVTISLYTRKKASHDCDLPYKQTENYQQYCYLKYVLNTNRLGFLIKGNPNRRYTRTWNPPSHGKT